MRDAPMTQRLARLLDSHEIRILGSLLEKQQATPEYYPLTLNALLAACNQKNNREPVMSLSEPEVEAALGRLREIGLVSRESGSRAVRVRQNLDRRLGLDGGRRAALTVLLLRGPQTGSEVRSRSLRMYPFASGAEVEEALADLAGPPDPLVMLLERDPGQREPRWAHRLGVDESADSTAQPIASRSTGGADATARPFDADLVLRRLERLEQQVQELQAAIAKRGIFD